MWLQYTGVRKRCRHIKEAAEEKGGKRKVKGWQRGAVRAGERGRERES